MTAWALLAVAALAVALSGCESTQTTSARLQREGKHAIDEKGLTVSAASRTLRVVSTSVLHDANGTAAVVELRNASSKPVLRPPLAISVLGGGHKVLFRNDAPGLQDALTHVPYLRARHTTIWVDDQVAADTAPVSVTARVGNGTPAPAKLPKLELSKPKLHVDPSSGIEAVGTVTNRSKIVQTALVITCVGRRHGKIVAAGRGVVQRLAAGKKAGYSIFFIGDPKGARLSVSAPPTVLR